MQNLKNYMFENNLTLGQISDLLGCNYPYLSRVINGKVNPGERLLYKINKLLEKKG